MKSICLCRIKTYTTHFLIIVMLMLSKTLNCAANQEEVARQAKITAFFTTYHAREKQQAEEGFAQSLLAGASRKQRKHNKGYARRQGLDVYKEEAEQKGDVISPPIGTLARAGAQQRQRNKAYTRELTTVLLAAQLPREVIKEIEDYARPEWFKTQHLKHHNDRIYNFSQPPQLPDRIISFSDSGAKQEAVAWEKDTGTFIQIFPNAIHYKARPAASVLLEQMGGSVTDSAISPDEQKVALSTFNQGRLYILPSKLSLGQALAQRQEVTVRNQKPYEDLSEEQLQQNPFMSVTFSPCSNYVFAGGADGIMHQIHTTTGAPVYSFEHDAAVTAITTSQDGNTIYAGLKNGGVSVWQGNPVPQSMLSQNISDAPDGPQTAAMHDEDIITVRWKKREITERRMLLCAEENFACDQHCLQSCFGPQRGSACVACCRTSASCAKHCPVTAAIFCYSKLRGRLIDAFKYWRQ